MSVSQIPNLTPATSLNGSEQLEAVQAGSSVRLTTAQIGTYVASTYPAPGISSVTANSPLSSSTTSGAVTIYLPTAAITNTYLGQMAAGTVKANLTGGTASPSDVLPSAILDTFSSTPGAVLYRGASAWQTLGIGTNTQILTSNGTTPYWTTLSVPSGNIAPTGVTAGTYGTASSVPQFTVLSSGQLSSATNVAISIPYTQVTGLGTMATQNASAVAITGGTINGVTIGSVTPGPASFTSLTATGTANFATIASGTWNGTAIGVAYGGTGATTAAGARTNLGAAASGANSDITSLTGLTTPLSETQGGTGYGSYTTGDLLYAASSTTLARLNDVAIGNSLISGGVGVAPSWGKIGLTTHVSGTLPVANGGTGATTLTGYLYGNGTGAFTASATIPNAGLANSTVTIGSTSISLGGTSTTIAGLTTLTLTQDPTAALQAATKQYVDGQVSAVSNTTYHTQCVASTTANLTATYSNGTGGVGATLTNSGAQAAFIADGQSLSSGNRVLVQFQSTAAQNGIYTVTTVGTVSTNWVLTRATDFDTVGTGPNYIETGAAVFVTSGSFYGATGWVMNTTGTIVVGTTGLNWTQTSSSSSVTVTSPLTKVGSVISLGTVPTTLGGTGLTTLTQYNVMLGNGTGNVAFAAPSTAGYALLSTGASSNPSFGQLSLTAGVTGTLPVANGGTGTATAFTTGSVVFAGASGAYSQSNTKLFWDNTNNRLGINTGSPQTQLTVLSNTQTTTPTGTLPAGTDIYIVGANAANTRITQDAYGTGSYGAYTARSARGTAASPTASQSGDILSQFTGRGYGATGFATASTGRFDITAAENFTDTAQGTYASVFVTAIGANSPTEAFRFGTAGQLGIGGATYGTSGYVLTSGGASAAPTWSQVSLTAGITGVLPVANGGTNISSYAVGDILYASGATTLSKLAAVATGNVLRSGGLVTAPAWGQVSLTTDVTGTLPIANGGTGLTSTPANGALDIGNGTGFTRTTLTQGTNIAITNGAGSISIAVSGTPSFATSITTPLVIGGTAVSSSLTLQSTSGVGTSDSILFKVGNNGATTAMTIDTSGNVGIGTSSPGTQLNVYKSTATQVAIRPQNSLAYADFGPISDGTVYGPYAAPAASTGLIVGTSNSNPVQLWTNGAERMRIDTSGNVGIGTSSPSYSLVVSKNQNAATVLQTVNNNTGASAAVILQSQIGASSYVNYTTSATYNQIVGSGITTQYIDFDTQIFRNTAGTERFRIGSAGQWGISGATYGTSGYVFTSGGASAAPTWSQVSLTAGVTGTLPVANGGTGVTTSTGTGSVVLSASPTLTGTLTVPTITSAASTALTIQSAGTTAMTVDTSQNVGIGTSSPNAKLQVNGGIYNSSQPIITTTTTLTSACLGSLVEVGGTSSYTITLPNPTLYNGGWFQLWLNNSNTITLSTPSGYIYGPTGNSSATQNITQTLSYWYFLTSDGYNWALAAMPRLDSSGNLLVGTTTVLSSAKLTIVQNGGTNVVNRNSGATAGKFWNSPYVDTSNNFYIINQSNTGVILTDGGTAWAANSDERLKDIIAPITSALEGVKSLRAVRYSWKNDEAKVPHVGLIAQDVQKVLPEVVQSSKLPLSDDETEYLAVAYTETIPLLVAAIQELSAKNDALAAQVTELSAKVAVLEQKGV